MLEFQSVSKTYSSSNRDVQGPGQIQGQNLAETGRTQSGQVQAMVDVSFSLKPGDYVAIRGVSGCGKSTLLLTAGGLQHPDGGQVFFEGDDIYKMSAGERAAYRAQHVGFVFQQFHLVPYLSVLDNVLAASMAQPNKASPRQANDRAIELCQRFGLQGRLHHTPSELSTGERQRTAMARALLNGPKLLLADEPTGNLDSQNAARILDDLSAFAAEGGAVLLVTHDDRATASAGQVMHMDAGRLALASRARE